MGRRRRALAVVAGWLVVVLHLVAAFGPAPVRLSPAETELADLAGLLGQPPAGKTISICSANSLGGAAGGDADPTGNERGGGHAGICAFCLPLLSAGATVPLALEPVRYPADAGLARLVPQVVGTRSTGPLAVAARPRAPPVQAPA